MTTKLQRQSAVLGLAALIALSACSSNKDSGSALQITPATLEVAPGDTVHYGASLAGAPNQPVAWSVAEPDGGTIDATGTYTAPATEGDYTVMATLTSLSTTQSAKISVRRNVRVTVSPLTATLTTGQTLQFSASASGTPDKAVTWSVAESGGGTVAADGTYTAPSTAGTYHVVATSAADPTKSGTATVTVSAPPVQAPAPAPVTVTVSPQTASVVEGDTLQLTATVSGASDTSVTWSVAESGGGTVSSTGLYTAPLLVGTFHVVATSVADPSQSATATISVNPTPTPPAPTPAPGGVMGPLLAFPYAQGAGAVSAGGRGGKVYVVNTLRFTTNSGCAPYGVGTCSLRDCMDATNYGSGNGARTCVFTVSGQIDVGGIQYQINNPYITIAGQTAPGMGITLTNNYGNNMRVLDVKTHDVVARYIRVRKLTSACQKQFASGAGACTNEGNVAFWSRSYTDAANRVGNYAGNIMFDHCSLSWASDESTQITSNESTTGIAYMSFSWVLQGEDNGDHQSGENHPMFMGGRYPLTLKSIDIHHSAFLGGQYRSPRLRGASTRLISSIMYQDPTSHYTVSDNYGAMSIDFIDNYWVPLGSLYEIGSEPNDCTPSGGPTDCNGNPSLYLSGNAGPSNPSASDSGQWSMVYNINSDGTPTGGNAPTNYRRPSPLPSLPSSYEVTFDPPGTGGANLANVLWNGVDIPNNPGKSYGPIGASRRLDCKGNWVDARDEFDQDSNVRYSNRTVFAPSGCGAFQTCSIGVEQDPGYVQANRSVSGNTSLNSTWSNTLSIINTGASGACTWTVQGLPSDWQTYWAAQKGVSVGSFVDVGHDLDPNYTNLEVYLSGLFPAQ